jgi:hypothetical protein
MALARIGHTQFITSLSESSNEAIVLNAFYTEVRDRVLSAMPWSFAKGQAALVLVEANPNTDWAYSYTYPADCIMAIRLTTSIGSTPTPFAIGNDAGAKLIYNDVEDAVLEYVIRVTAVGLFPAVFVSALAYLLAHEVAIPLSRMDRMDRMMQAYQMELVNAGSYNLNEQQEAPEPLNHFTASRE